MENLNFLSQQFNPKCNLIAQKYYSSDDNIRRKLKMEDIRQRAALGVKINGDNRSSVTDSLCYHEKIMKQAITGVF